METKLSERWAEITAATVICYRLVKAGMIAARAVRAARTALKKETTMDIVNIKALVSVAAALGSVAGATMEDGKVDMKDLALLPKLIPVFPALLAIDFKQVVPEAKDLSEAEALELVEHYKAEFAIPQADLEIKIEAVLSLCVRLYGIIAEIVALFKKGE